MKFLMFVHLLASLLWLKTSRAFIPHYTHLCHNYNIQNLWTLNTPTLLLSTIKKPNMHGNDNQESKQSPSSSSSSSSGSSNLHSVTQDAAAAAAAAAALSAADTETTTTTPTPITPPKHGILLVYGPDQKGIVAAFSQLLYGHGCGISSSEQSTDTSTNLFFQRLCFDYSTMHTDRISLETGIREVCQRFRMHNRVDWCQRKKRVAIMVSKYDHCLWEILLRHQAKELDCDISVIISNHPDLQHVADTFGIP
jgi:formyltetrahydrofolate deformylase